MDVRSLLKKYNALSKEIANVDFHMNLLNTDLEYLKAKIPKLENISEKELLEFIVQVFRKCDYSSPEFDSELDTKMIRIGLKTDEFYGGRNRNKWNNEMFQDDWFGFGRELTSLHDDYVDDMNDYLNEMEDNTHSR